jgi:hypothetical protein
MQGQLMSVSRRVASASRFLPSPSDGLHALSGRSPHLTSGKVDKRITTCGKRFALLRALSGRSLRLRTAHRAVRLTAQQVRVETPSVGLLLGT